MMGNEIKINIFKLSKIDKLAILGGVSSNSTLIWSWAYHLLEQQKFILIVTNYSILQQFHNFFWVCKNMKFLFASFLICSIDCTCFSSSYLLIIYIFSLLLFIAKCCTVTKWPQISKLFPTIDWNRSEMKNYLRVCGWEADFKYLMPFITETRKPVGL